MSHKNQNKDNSKKVTTNEDNIFEKALGKETVAETPETPEVVAETPETVAETVEETVEETTNNGALTFEQIVKFLPENSVKRLMSVPDEANRLAIAKDMFALLHPEGLQDEFKNAVAEYARKVAEDFMVNPDGKILQITFQGGEVVSSFGDPSAKSQTKKGSGSSAERWASASITTSDGAVHHFESAGKMAKALGYASKGWGFSDTTQCFTKPRALETGDQLEQAYVLDMTKMGKTPSGDWDKSRGLHIKAIQS